MVSHQPADGLKAFEGPGVNCASHKATTSAGLLCTCPSCYASRKGAEGKRRGLEAAKSTERGSTTKETRNKSLLYDCRAKQSSWKGKKHFSKMAWKLDKQF